MAAILKVQHGDEIYRLTVEGPLNFDAVVHSVSAALSDLPPGAVKGGLKYVDDEGELCTLTEMSFEDFLEVAGAGGSGSGSRVLKLQLRLPPASPPAAVPAAVAAPVPSAAPATSAAPTPSAAPAPSAAAGSNGAAEREQADGSDSEEDGEEELGGEDTWGGWPCGMHGGAWPLRGGLRKCVRMLKALKDSGVPLNPAALASLAVHGLPKLTEMMANKIDAVNRKAKKGIDEGLLRLLKLVQEMAAATPGLEQTSEPLAKALAAAESASGPFDLGGAILGLLLDLGALTIEAQQRFAERVMEAVLPMLDELAATWQRRRGCRSPHGADEPRRWWRITCDGCGMHPLVGLRFKCTVCPDYDLCEACYQRKEELHAGCPGGDLDFENVQGKGDGWKGCGKGKGLGKGFGKGFGKCGGKGWRGKGGKAWLAALLGAKGAAAGTWMGCCSSDGTAQQQQQQQQEQQQQQQESWQWQGQSFDAGCGSGSSGWGAPRWQGCGPYQHPWAAAFAAAFPFPPAAPPADVTPAATPPAEAAADAGEQRKRKQPEQPEDQAGEPEKRAASPAATTTTGVATVEAATAAELAADPAVEATAGVATAAATEVKATAAAEAAPATVPVQEADVVEVVNVEDAAVDELTEKLAMLRELGLGSDDVNRELLAVAGGDASRVVQMLLGD